MTLATTGLFSYPGHPVLEDVSFQIAAGECIAIIGPNGGGKTTLLSLLMGFLRPSKGEITLQGGPVQKCKHTIGYVPQNFQYDRKFPITVLEVVLTGRLKSAGWFGYKDIDYTFAHEMLRKVGMREYASALFSELSSGQAQRVLIARALAAEPHFLFLDEAVSNVDTQTQEAIFQILQGLKGKITILLVTHDLKAALGQIDRVLLVQTQVAFVPKAELCEHFAMGLFHPPLHPLQGSLL